jgi:hypothetical protein
MLHFLLKQHIDYDLMVQGQEKYEVNMFVCMMPTDYKTWTVAETNSLIFFRWSKE